MGLLDLNTGGSWKDGYLQASFRNVPFYVLRDRYATGRKLNEHEFIDSDESYDEDSGKKKGVITISAYLIGDDFYNKRNDLIDALNKEGEGILVHPYYGEINVKVLDVDAGHEIESGRMCTIDITFKEQKIEALIILPESAFNKLTESVGILQTILQALATAYDFASKPVGLMDDMLDVIDQCIDIMESAKTITGLVDEFQAKLDAFKGKAENISFMGETIWEDLQELVEFGTDIEDSEMNLYTMGEAGKEQFNGLKNISNIQDATLTKYPSIGNEEGAPAREFQKYISRQALAARSKLVATMDIKNITDADSISKELDTEIRKIEDEINIDDDLFSAAQDLRVAIKAMIAERKLSLSELTKIELDEFKPGIVLSFDLYGKIDRDTEIAELNDILHPGFIQGKRELLVNNK